MTVHTAAEFDAFILLPENHDQSFELIAGEIVPVVSNSISSKISGWILTYINNYLEDHDIGHSTPSDGGYWIGDERYIPDVAFTSYARLRIMLPEGYQPLAPDLAVEVLSPGNTKEEITIKIANYLAAGTVVWRVDHVKRQVAVFVPNQAVRILDENDSLDGGNLLPGFQLPLKKLFKKLDVPGE
jgi:Uma2 family endonuclease